MDDVAGVAAQAPQEVAGLVGRVPHRLAVAHHHLRGDPAQAAGAHSVGNRHRDRAVGAKTVPRQADGRVIDGHVGIDDVGGAGGRYLRSAGDEELRAIAEIDQGRPRAVAVACIVEGKRAVK